MDAAHKSIAPRKSPAQTRSKRTVEWILEGAARVFRAEGFAATTNRIAQAAGVSVGSLYEYFPNKQALLVALAERHVVAAEQGVESALTMRASAREFLSALQAAILGSQRYPSHAIDLVADPCAAADLRTRVQVLRERVLSALVERARAIGCSDPELRARAVFGVIAELSSRSLYEASNAKTHAALAAHLLELGIAHLAA